MDTSSLQNIEGWKDYAAGIVNECYPNPVQPDTILDLACFERSEHDAEYVYVILANKYNSGYMGEDFKYVPAQLPSGVDENDFNDTMGTMNESSLKCKITYRANKRFLHHDLYKVQAESVSELILQMAKDGAKGTVRVFFSKYPNGTKYKSELVKNFSIVL